MMDAWMDPPARILRLSLGPASTPNVGSKKIEDLFFHTNSRFLSKKMWFLIPPKLLQQNPYVLFCHRWSNFSFGSFPIFDRFFGPSFRRGRQRSCESDALKNHFRCRRQNRSRHGSERRGRACHQRSNTHRLWSSACWWHFCSKNATTE